MDDEHVTSTRFEGRTVIVTGAAGDIGGAAVRRLANEGATVLAVDMDGGKLAETAATISGGSGSVTTFVADVSDSSAVLAYVEAARELSGGAIHGLFNNAGIEGPVASIDSYPEDAFEKVCAVNIRGVFLGMRHAIAHMPSGGAIVNTASTGGVVGFPGGGAYVAAKHATVGLTRVAALDLAPRGIRVNAICPGPVAGRMAKALEDQIGIPDVLTGTVPLGRKAEPEEIAATATFLLSDDASFTTGGVYMIDGGATAS